MRRGRTRGWLGLLLVLLAALAWLLGGTRSGARPNGGAEPARAERSAAELRLAAARAAESSLAAPAAIESSPEAARERSAPSAQASARTRRPLRGRLWIAESGEPLAEVLRVFLHTGKPGLAQWLESAPDGSFASTLEFPSGLVMARVLRPAGDEAVDQEIPFDPALDQEWIVNVPWPTFVHGKLVDAAGEPLAEVEVSLSRSADPRRLRHRTGDDGEFLVEGAHPGPATLTLSNGFERSEVRLEVARGPNELGDLVLPFARCGEVSGRVLANDEEPAVTLLLFDEGRGSGLCASTSALGDDGTFAFDDVPAGAYRLEIVARDGVRYEPSALHITAPATDLEFREAGRQDAFRLVAVDGSDALLDTYALVRVSGQWLLSDNDVPRAAVERWVVLSGGYRPAQGERPSADVRAPLERGFGQAYLFTEVGGDLGVPYNGGRLGRALARVEVVGDGRVLAQSDADGFAVVSSATTPSALEFRLPGWRVQRQITNGRFTHVALERE